MSAPDAHAAVAGAFVAHHLARAGARVDVRGRASCAVRCPPHDPGRSADCPRDPPGIVAATGHGHPGMTPAPATGELIAADLTARSRV